MRFSARASIVEAAMTVSAAAIRLSMSGVPDCT